MGTVLVELPVRLWVLRADPDSQPRQWQQDARLQPSRFEGSTLSRRQAKVACKHSLAWTQRRRSIWIKETHMARATAHQWPRETSGHGHAPDGKPGVFKLKDPKRIAASLKESAEHSERPKASAYRSAMSKLTVYINRAGAQLQPDEKKRLEQAKDELRSLYHPRPSTGRTTALGRRVEKPGESKPGGPSGQRDSAKGDRKHANK
jgi:hypothetical protein